MVDTPVAPLRVVVGDGGHTRGASQGGCWWWIHPWRLSGWLLVMVDTPVAPLRVVVVDGGHTSGASQGGCW